MVSEPRPEPLAPVLAHDLRESFGSEIPVVLLHAGVADRRMWDPQWARLTTAVDGVRVDLRGFGASEDRPGAPFAHVEDLLATLDALAVTRFHLVGASLGAGVAVETALARPGAVESLVLTPPGGSLLVTRTADLASFAAAEGAALGRGDVDAAVRVNLETWLAGPRRRVEDLRPGLVHAVERMQRRAFEIQLGWGAGVEETTPVADPMDHLAEVDVPVLLVVGGLDLDATLDAADRLTAGLLDVTRVDWPEVAHLPSLEEPDRFTDLLLEWLVP